MTVLIFEMLEKEKNKQAKDFYIHYRVTIQKGLGSMCRLHLETYTLYAALTLGESSNCGWPVLVTPTSTNRISHSSKKKGWMKRKEQRLYKPIKTRILAVGSMAFRVQTLCFSVGIKNSPWLVKWSHTVILGDWSELDLEVLLGIDRNMIIIDYRGQFSANLSQV